MDRHHRAGAVRHQRPSARDTGARLEHHRRLCRLSVVRQFGVLRTRRLRRGRCHGAVPPAVLGRNAARPGPGNRLRRAAGTGGAAAQGSLFCDLHARPGVCHDGDRFQSRDRRQQYRAGFAAAAERGAVLRTGAGPPGGRNGDDLLALAQPLRPRPDRDSRERGRRRGDGRQHHALQGAGVHALGGVHRARRRDIRLLHHLHRSGRRVRYRPQRQDDHHGRVRRTGQRVRAGGRGIPPVGRLGSSRDEGHEHRQHVLRHRHRHCGDIHAARYRASRSAHQAGGLALLHR